MSDFELLRKEVENGIAGTNAGISMGFYRLNRYIGIRKRIYTVIFGAPGSGKSAFVHSAFILNPYDWYISKANTTDVKLKIILFSMERSKVYFLAKWVSRRIFLDHGKMIPIQKLMGWWEQRINKEEYELFSMYEDYIDQLTETVDIIEGAQNPTAIYKYVKQYAENNGVVKKLDEYKSIYIPNHPNEIVIPIMDHLGLTKPEKSQSKKEAIDMVSGYAQRFRDFYGYTPVAVSQMTRDISNPIYQKLDSFEPNLDQIKESGRPAEDSDCVISLFQPSRYKTNDVSYNVGKFVDESNGADYFRSIKILKNTYGESDVRIGMAFQGWSGIFQELPKKKEMENFNYGDLFNGSYFLPKIY